LRASADDLFSGFDPKTGWELWKSDGPIGHLLVRTSFRSGKLVSGPAVGVGDTLYVTAFHPDTGSELWEQRRHGERDGLVKDINPGRAGSNPDRLVGVTVRWF